jgi:hypothetical protein
MQFMRHGFVALLTVGALNPANADDSLSGQAFKNASGASLHASANFAHAIAASGQATFAVSAIPFAVGGSVGAVSGQIAKDSMRIANTPIGTSLVISDDVLTISPPNEALKTKPSNKDEQK